MRRSVTFGFAAVLALCCAAAAQAPRVTRVEPPNWWVGLPDPVLLVSGENLGGAHVTSSDAGVSVTGVEPGAAGRHLFVHLHVAPDARPGDARLALSTAAGKVEVSYPLAARHFGGDAFNGLTAGDVMYLIMPDRFADGDASNDQPIQSPGTYDRGKARAYHGGDLRGIREHLPYLRDLGVTALWLTPIVDNDNQSPNDYHGYGAVDYYAVDEHFGSVAELQRLVAEAHANGIKVFLDFVPNHTGPRHPWVDDPPEEGWFHGTPQRHLTSTSPFTWVTDPHATEAHKRDLLDGWFAGVLPDNRQENPHVAAYFVDNAMWWAESTGIDGYRLDTFPYVPRTFWSEWHRALFGVYPRMTTIGEIFHRDPSVIAFFIGGERQFDGVDSGLSTAFDYGLFSVLRDVLVRGRPASDLQAVFGRDFVYRHPERLVTFFGNHDNSRLATAAGGDLSAVKLAYGLLLTARGIPQLYAGDEIGMPGGDDPDNRRDFPGGFPGDARNAFTAEGRTAEQQDVFACAQALLRLRRAHSALRDGEQFHLLADDTVYAFGRSDAAEKLLVVFNSGKAERSLDVPLADTPYAAIRSITPLFGGGSGSVTGARARLVVPARSVVVFEVR